VRRFVADNRHSAAILLGLVLLALVAAGAIGLLEWRHSEEDDATKDVLGNAQVAAKQAESFLGGASPALAATVGDAIEDGEPDLSEDLGVRGEAWQLDGDGDVLASTGAGRLGSPPEARAVLGGSLAVSGFVEAPGAGRAVRLAIPLSGDERAVAVVAVVPARFLAGLIAPALEHIPSDSPADAAVVGPDGRALVSTGLERPAAEQLVVAGRDAGSGEIEIDGRTHLYSSAPLAGPWTVVLAAPEEDVLATAGGPAGWMGWALLAEVALAGLLGALLLTRLLRDFDRADRANVELSERSASAEHATEVKSGFISTLAHEMRTPLAAIGMFAEMMRTDREEPLQEGQRRRATDIAVSARHVLDLLDETLDMSRIESGRLELRPERASVAAIGIQVVDGLHPLALDRGIDLSIEADGKLGEVFVDPGRVRQVMTNFLSNALKFTPTGGRVRLRVERHGEDSFEVAVDDTGIGIDPEHAAEVFTATHRPAEPLHPGDEASGFGLAVTKRLVEAMGGSVGAQSRLGSGSTFSAVLPRVSAERRPRLP